MTFSQPLVYSDTSALDIEIARKPHHQTTNREDVYKHYFEKLMNKPNSTIYTLLRNAILAEISESANFLDIDVAYFFHDTALTFFQIAHQSLEPTAALDLEGLTRSTVDVLIDTPLADMPLSEHKVRLKLTFVGRGEPVLKSEIEYDPYDEN